jgi:hypothetical protein
LYEQGCTDNADCSGELICDASLGVCKKNEDKTLCTKGSCESGYFCSKNGVFVNKGYGSVCLQSFAKSKGSTCYKDMECKTGLRCILNNKKIANQYEDNTNYLYTLGKEWSHKISDPTAGVCENLTETGFCEDTSDCSSGLTCTNGVCSVASTTAEKLSLLTPCNYSIDCKSGFCTKIGNKQVCTISDDLFLSGNQITSSYGLVSNAPFTGSVEEEWGTGKKYYPDCRKSQIILNKEYKESSFCKIAFGEKYSKCQSYDGVCAEFENEKYLAGLDSEAYKITVRVLFEMSCVGGMSGYEDDAVYKHVLSFGCNEGDIKPQCETVFSHPTRKFCGASGSNLVTFDLAGITFNPITDYAISYTSEGGKEFDMDDEPGKDYDSDNYSINLPKITNGTATCMITRVTQTYKNVEDELISSIYVECYNGEE